MMHRRGHRGKTQDPQQEEGIEEKSSEKKRVGGRRIVDRVGAWVVAEKVQKVF